MASDSAARPHSQYAQREWYPRHQHVGFIEAIASSSDRLHTRSSSDLEQRSQEDAPRMALDRPMSPEIRAWGAQVTQAVAHAQATSALAQAKARDGTRANWSVQTGGDMRKSPVISPVDDWQGLRRQHGPFPSKLKSQLEPEPEELAEPLQQKKPVHRGPMVSHAHPQRAGSPGLLVHKDRREPGTETIVCYLSAEDVGWDADRERLQAVCADQLNLHGTPVTNIIKFSLGDLWDPSRITPTRVKVLSRALSSYSGRIAVIAPSGSGPDQSYDLGALSGRVSSSAMLAERICGFLRHLRTHKPAMVRTTHIDLLVCAAGANTEDSATVRTPAHCLLDALRAHDDGLTLDERVFARPLIVAAPKGELAYVGGFTVYTDPSEEKEVFNPTRDPRAETPACATGLKGFLAEQWDAADLDEEAMLVATVETEAKISHQLHRSAVL